MLLQFTDSFLSLIAINEKLTNQRWTNTFNAIKKIRCWRFKCIFFEKCRIWFLKKCAVFSFCLLEYSIDYSTLISENLLQWIKFWWTYRQVRLDYFEVRQFKSDYKLHCNFQLTTNGTLCWWVLFLGQCSTV